MIGDSTKFPFNLFYDRFWTQRARRCLYNLVSPSLAWRTSRFWEENRNKYAGRRGFVIGNGPSLKTADLTALKDEISIASNRIYLAYPETPWRPTFHTCSDKLVWKKYATEICQNSDQVIIASNLNAFRGDTKKTILSWNAGPGLKGGFSNDQRLGSYSGYTVTFINLQIAVHLGLNPIYLIGCDHYYGPEQQHFSKGFDTKGTIVKEANHHFHKDYRKPGEKVFSAPIHLMNCAYDLACSEGQKLGVQIFNATRGGHLESFPRADLDQLIQAPGSGEIGVSG